MSTLHHADGIEIRRTYFDVVAIEDNPGDAQLIREVFEEDERVRVRIAWNGTEGLALLEEQAAPDLVLLDISLPGLNGLDLVRAIREHEALERVPIVMFTGSQLIQDVRDAEVRGADRFVLKPFDVLEYLDALRGLRQEFFPPGPVRSSSPGS